MSKPRYPWWGYVKNVIRAYPELKRELEDLHEQRVTANLSDLNVCGGSERGLESIVMRQLSKPKQQEYDAVHRTVSLTMLMKTGQDRLRLIDMVFWKNAHTLRGAAGVLSISYDTAVNYHGDFIMLVAWHRGLVTFDELKNTQKIALKSQKPVLE